MLEAGAASPACSEYSALSAGGHFPDLIVVAPELPRTKSNKLVELAVTDVINGREVRNRDALANPDSLDWFKGLVP